MRILSIIIAILTATSSIADDWTGPTSVSFEDIYVDSPTGYFVDFNILIAFAQIKNHDDDYIDYMKENLIDLLVEQFYGNAGSAGNINLSNPDNLSTHNSGFTGEYYKLLIHPLYKEMVSKSTGFKTKIEFDTPQAPFESKQWLDYKESIVNLQAGIVKYNQTLNNIEAFLESIEEGHP